jgi:hypothetical protein
MKDGWFGPDAPLKLPVGRTRIFVTAVSAPFPSAVGM